MHHNHAQGQSYGSFFGDDFDNIDLEDEDEYNLEDIDIDEDDYNLEDHIDGDDDDDYNLADHIDGDEEE